MRREVPKRSVTTLIQILEWEGKIAPGSVSRSTLQDHLSKAGYSNAQMRIYRQEPIAARRFQHANHNNLWQSDIKYGPYLQVKPSYLVAFLDDCTRFVLHAEFTKHWISRLWSMFFGNPCGNMGSQKQFTLTMASNTAPKLWSEPMPNWKSACSTHVLIPQKAKENRALQPHAR